MADTYCVTSSLVPFSDLNQLPPNPPLRGEESVTTAVLLPTLGGNPGLPNVTPSPLFAIFNQKGSSKTVKVLDFHMVETQGRTTTATTFQFGLARCSAMSGGDDVDVVKMDTDGADIPPEVLIREVVGAYTLSGTSLRKMLDLPQMNPTRAMPYPVWRGAASSGNNDRLYGSNGADIQGQILREGQGIVALTTAGTGKEPFPLAVNIIFSIGTDSYLARSRGSADTFPAFLGIFNGTGSGVVITINQVWVAELTTDETSIRRLQLETISGCRTIDPLDATPMDSTSPSLPSSIIVTRKAACLQKSADALDAGPRADENLLRRLVCADQGQSPGLATPFTKPTSVSFGADIFKMAPGEPFVLREGEGLALFQRQTNSGLSFGYQLSVMFSVEDVTGQQIAPVLGSSIVRGGLV